MAKLGPVQKKILLYLSAGLSIMTTGSIFKHISIVSDLNNELEKVNKQVLNNAIAALYRNKLVRAKRNTDGTLSLFINDKGRERALTYKIDDIVIKRPQKWDKRWRIVIFDIPEKYKKGRNIVSQILVRLGFYRLQKSVFVFPHECSNELDFIIELYGLRQYVRQILADHIDNEYHLRIIFKL